VKQRHTVRVHSADQMIGHGHPQLESNVRRRRFRHRVRDRRRRRECQAAGGVPASAPKDFARFQEHVERPDRRGHVDARDSRLAREEPEVLEQVRLVDDQLVDAQLVECQVRSGIECSEVPVSVRTIAFCACRSIVSLEKCGPSGDTA
jgi:hypothetical protein